MSGRKYSRVELANNVREAIRCRLAAEEVYERSRSLVAALNTTARSLAPLKPIADVATMTLEEIRKQLEEIRASFAEKKMMRLTLYTVQEKRREVEQLRLQLESVAQKSREASESAELLMELNAVLSALQSEGDELRSWLSDTYDKFLEDTQSLVQGTQSELELTGNLNCVADKILGHVEQYKSLLRESSERRTEDAERRYVAEALQRICKEELGFVTRLLSQKNFCDDLVLEVNTFAYGLLHFRLQLDGTVRSQSEMVEKSCCANFTLIENHLRSLGIISNFRYEGDQQPVTLRKGENALPDAEPAAVIEGAKK
jgi:hypothetical protein